MEVSFRYRAKAMLMKLILGDPENFCVFPPNQKAERQQSFGTGLVRRCPQRLFSPFFTFPWAIFFCPFRLSLAPTICLWVSKDEWNCVMPILKYGQCSQPFVPLSPFLERPMGLIHTAAMLSQETEHALFYHPRPCSEKLGSGARQVKQRFL